VSGEVVLEMRGITMRFPGVLALDGVSFSLNRGEVHALLGENGAGKSTLIKILAGIYTAGSGELYIGGKKAAINGVNDARALGISVIHQELCLAKNLSVAENIFMGREFKKLSGLVDKQKANLEAKKILEKLGSALDPRTRVSGLSTAQQQIVEIAKSLSVDAKIFVMDEPTAMLAKNDVEKLFEIVKSLQQNGISVIYISHRLDEIFTLADRVTMLRDGTVAGVRNVTDTNRQELIKMMVGREIQQFYIHEKRNISGGVVLEVKNLSTIDKLRNVSFSLKKGEIIGFSGLVGAGRTEVARALYGIDQISEGEIYLNGEKVNIKSPQDAIRHGLALVPESRRDDGLVMIQNVGFNITLAVLDSFMQLVTTNKQKENGIINSFFELLSIRASSAKQIAGELSGGNQQKVVLAKKLATKPVILILDEPTRGIDVGAKVEIYKVMNKLAENGVGIIMISSELPEILNISDRVIVMNDGSVAATVEGSDINQETIMTYSLGLNKHE
jgi:ribose transport system ATP-binding protein/inositol transport system ATP-binding protein